MSIFSHPILDSRAILRHLLPVQPCLLCGTPSRNGIWCDACEAGLPVLDTMLCPHCALPTSDGSICGRCLKRPPAFDRTVAAYAYTFPLDQLVQALKFGEQLVLAKALAEQLARRVEHRPDFILPMPLHPLRLRERGYNQSLELARHLGRELDIPVFANHVQRVRATLQQSSLPWRERRRNVRRAFTCTTSLHGKHVALVDDVMTSGATLEELAHTVRRAGAGEVSAWVVARTLRQG